jgi:hypothetical protein
MGVIGLFLNKEPVLECTFPDGGTMTISEMLQQSGILTLLGMGVVFAFLVVHDRLHASASCRHSCMQTRQR